ncbi:hypothetical protein [Streptomyces sp. NPDC006285]|uniref:hypothetical protein n=1 Tax=Streptomyces sp. NPDC006285 TaxID=3364742 RepID=UPI0036920B7F
MTTEVTLNLRERAPVPGIHAETPEGRVTFGFDADLNAATGDALDAMLGWLCTLFDLDRTTALALAGAVVDLRITQVANDTWGVHAVLPYDAVRSVRGVRNEYEKPDVDPRKPERKLRETEWKPGTH